MKKITNKKLTKKYTDGRKYVGEFKDGSIEGQGTYIWTNGTKYVGEYKDDKIHGQGTYIFKALQKIFLAKNPQNLIAYLILMG